MSIWCSQSHVGHGHDDHHEPDRGVVRAYREGWGNHYPDDTDPMASLDLADIAPWCVPGHGEPCDLCGEGHDYPDTGPWLRLGIDSPAAESWWSEDGTPGPHPAPLHGCVVLDEAAATALRDDLTAWLAQPKLTPAEDRIVADVEQLSLEEMGS